MASSGTILTLFVKVPDKNKFGLAVSLEDKRDRIRRWIDRLNNIKQFEGDIMLSSTWRNIDKIMQGRKADLIMERAFSGLNTIPINPRLYAILINKAWKILSDREGVMLLQVPSERDLLAAGIYIQDSVNNLKADGVNAEYFKSDVSTARSVLKLIKSAGSPEKLPFLK